MAHSFLSVRNSSTEKTISVTDSILYLFMYLFTEELNKNELDQKQLSIFNHYDLELTQLNTSFVNLKLQEIYQDIELLDWYSSVLSRLLSLMDSYGYAIDPNHLNGITKLKKEYSRPIEVSKLKNLINDLYWLLGKEDVCPSEDFKWFEYS